LRVDGCRTGRGEEALLKGNDIGGAIPGVADAAGVGGGIDAGPPAGLGGAVAGDDIVILAGGEGGGFLDADDVVFEAEVGIDVFFALEVAGDDAGAVGESEGGAGSGPGVREAGEEASAEVLEIFEVGLADLAQEQALETGEALAIVGISPENHLGKAW